MQPAPSQFRQVFHRGAFSPDGDDLVTRAACGDAATPCAAGSSAAGSSAAGSSAVGAARVPGASPPVRCPCHGFLPG